MASQIQIVDAARVCHEANRAFCETLGDDSQLSWELAPEWQRQSAVKGVQFILDNPGAPTSSTHESWMKEKIKEGWVYGDVKDPEAKLHPCLVPYDALPLHQQTKDHLFKAVVKSILRCE
jgi:hypothetical protein